MAGKLCLAFLLEQLMSVVTNILLSLSYEDAELIPVINGFFKAGQGFQQESIRGNCGGTKCMEKSVFPAAFNYLDLQAFKDYLNDIPWSSPERVQMFYCQQEEETFTEWNPTP